MPTVALVGADGAGKTTVGRRLAGPGDPPITYLYMGVNLDASNAMLPTTRLAMGLKRRRAASSGGGSDAPGRRADRGRSASRSLLGEAKSLLRTSSWMAEEWYRQLLAWRASRRGHIVLFDRHFLPDYYAHDVQPGARRRSLGSRLHGFMLRHLYPVPDLVIVLDAPPEVLRARKNEDSLEFLAARRAEYLALEDVVPRLHVVDATQPLDDVVDEVRALIRGVTPGRDVRRTSATP